MVKLRGDQVRLGIDAPAGITALREELVRVGPKPLAS
ncbi:carbon storage regulator [Thioalkalivibrio sp.]